MIALLAIAPILLRALEVTVAPVEVRPAGSALVSGVGPVGLSPVDLRLDNVVWQSPQFLPDIESSPFLEHFTAASTVGGFPADRWLEICDVLPDALGRVSVNGRTIYGGSAYFGRVRELGRIVATGGFSDAAMQEAAELRDAVPDKSQ